MKARYTHKNPHSQERAIEMKRDAQKYAHRHSHKTQHICIHKIENEKKIARDLCSRVSRKSKPVSIFFSSFHCVCVCECSSVPWRHSNLHKWRMTTILVLIKPMANHHTAYEEEQTERRIMLGMVYCQFKNTRHELWNRNTMNIQQLFVPRGQMLGTHRPHI